MKRFAMFLVWTLVVWAFILFVGSQVSQVMQIGKYTEAQPEPATARDGFTVGLRAGVEAQRAGFAFAKQNWHTTLGISLALAGLGSIARILPGTGKPGGPPPLPTR
jgi:hypothetical protein